MVSVGIGGPFETTRISWSSLIPPGDAKIERGTRRGRGGTNEKAAGGGPPAAGPRWEVRAGGLSRLRTRDSRRTGAQPLLLLLEDDDAGRNHQHQAAGRPADADVAEQAVDQGRLREDRGAELVALLAEDLDAAQEHRAAVGDRDGRIDGGEAEVGQLNRSLDRGGTTAEPAAADGRRDREALERRVGDERRGQVSRT
jgi:hypothetical protein